MPRATIILPTYNEAKNITRVIEALARVFRTIHHWSMQILVIDSTSPDGTGEVVTRLRKDYPFVNLIQTPKEGLGKAYITGMNYAIDHLDSEVVFEMDADLSHNPEDIPRFLQAINDGADFVLGTRYSKGGSIPADWGLYRKFLSFCGNLILRLGFMRPATTDWTGGYRAIRSWLVKKVTPHLDGYTGYVFQVAFLDRAMHTHAKIIEIPIAFQDRTEGVSKINAKQYAIQTILYMFSNSSFIKYCFVGLSGLIVDMGIAALLWAVGMRDITANRISMEMAVISNYLLNNFWVFRHKKHSHLLHHIRAFAQFNVVALGSFAIQELGIRLGKYEFGDAYWLWYKLCTIIFIVMPYSYILYNKVVWKKK
jgi:dolichol-phosphate mannosyltransferase